jgi:hypothetical protein
VSALWWVVILNISLWAGIAGLMVVLARRSNREGS